MRKLSRLEHDLLSSFVTDMESLYLLHADARRDLRTSTQDIVDALLLLVRLGFARAYFIGDYSRGYERRMEVSKEELLNHLSGYEDEYLLYPREGKVGEYHFAVTDEGRVEEAKEQYDAYYPAQPNLDGQVGIEQAERDAD